MTAQPFVVSSEDRPQPLNVVGEHITVLASAGQIRRHRKPTHQFRATGAGA